MQRNIGILGAGHIGATVARLLASAGYRIAISNSGPIGSLSKLVNELQGRVQQLEPAETARFGEVVLLAIPWVKRDTLPGPGNFAGKIVIDAMNAYSEQFEPIDLGDTTSSEIVARSLAGSLLVKSFNTLYWEVLATRATVYKQHRIVLPVSGDDGGAKALVSELIDECGFAPLDLGDLHSGGRIQQPGGPLYNKPISLTEATSLLRTLPGGWLR